jgi:hypothetical protein
MKIMRTGLAFDDGTGNIYWIDTIKWRNSLWLVPEWLDAPEEGWSTPARIVLLAQFQHQVLDGSGEWALDFLVNDAVPKAVFEGTMSPQQAKRFVVIERPPIRIRGGRA